MLNYPRSVQVGGWEENLMQHSIRMAFVWKEKMCFIMEFCYFTLSLELIPNHIKYFCIKVTYAKSYPGSNLDITGFHRQPKTRSLFGRGTGNSWTFRTILWDHLLLLERLLGLDFASHLKQSACVITELFQCWPKHHCGCTSACGNVLVVEWLR